MSINEEQMRYIRVLSDTELYKHAIDFLNTEVEVNHQFEQRPPLPNTQINGLLNVAQANTYGELIDFIKHQRDRNWQGKYAYIKIFYEHLERVLKEMPEFAKREGLIPEDLSIQKTREEIQKISDLLACEFIQHLAAENLVRERERIDEEKKQRRESHD
jgi:hypothetical protein